MEKNSWISEEIKTTEILLDYQNARIDANEKSTQEEIRELLLKGEKIVELANGIINANGLLYGERIIVVKEHGHSVVLEGNRRVCACQLLLNPNLVPKEFKSVFLACEDENLKKELGSLRSDVAPNRLAAEVTITKRHTEPGVEPWTPIAKQRRITRLVEAGRSIDDLTSEFGMTRPNILKTLKDYHLFQYAKNLSLWSKREKDILNDPTLSINPFTRFFDLKGVKKILGLKHKETGDLEIGIKKELFDKIIAFIAHEFLIPDKSTNRLGANTRTTSEELFKRISSRDKKLAKFFNISMETKTSKKKGDEPAKTLPSAKATKFFENLSCPIQDDHLIIVTEEISKINYKTCPLAATFLLRALIERTLKWCIKQYNLNKDLQKEFYKKYKGKKGIQPGLDFIITFCINKSDKIFTLKRIKSILGQWKKHKELLDIIIHVEWIRPDIKDLEHCAKTVRPTIEKIFSKEILINK